MKLRSSYVKALAPEVTEMDPEVYARELEWERGSVDRGVVRYRNSLLRVERDGTTSEKGLDELEPGQVIAREVLAHLTPAIKEAQEEAVVGIAKATRRLHAWWWPILCIPADHAAVITVRSTLSAPQSQNGMAARSVALEIGRHVKTQREFMLWRDAENRRSREAKAAGQKVPNWWTLMRERAPEIDERAFRKFSAKSPHYDRLEWDRTTRLAIGMRLLGLLAERGGGWFEMVLEPRMSGRAYVTERVVRLTEPAQEWVRSRHVRNEFNRPWLLPMLNRPIPWRRV